MAETVIRPAFMQPGTPDYLEHKGPWLRKYLIQVEGDCVPFAEAAQELKETGYFSYYVQGEADWSRFCREYLDTEAAFVDRIIEGAAILRNRGRNGTIPAQEAVHAARENPAKGQGGQEGNSNAARGEGGNEGGNGPFVFERPGPNTQGRTLRRLARDRPDLLDRVETGELTPNAAAIEAGFRKRKVQVEPTPDAVQRMLDKHMPGWRLMNEETGETA